MVHIHAPWGAGKTSLLNFLAADLRNRPSGGNIRATGVFPFIFGPRRTRKPQLSRWIVVDFNAWEHQRLATPWWWLLAAVQRACARELWWIDQRRWLWFWICDIAWRIWNVRVAVLAVMLLAILVLVAWALDWFGLSGQSLTALQTVLLTAGSAVALATTLFGVVRGAGRWLAIGSAEGADRFLRRSHDPLGVYRHRFRWLVRSSGQPIAVFIDDLDRCRAERVVQLLEGIQTLFAQEPVAYVVAADRDWICQSFATAYEDFGATAGDTARPLGFRFLEKTFQISMEIPPISGSHRDRYWARLIGDPTASPDPPVEPAQSPSTAPVAEEFAEVFTQEGVEHRVDSLLKAGRDPEEVFEGAVRRLNTSSVERETEMLLTPFAPLLERNPRVMKRLVNAYGFERDLLVRSGRFPSETERKLVALRTILRLRWPLFADYLREKPEDADFCVDGAVTPPDNHPFREQIADPAIRALFDETTVGVRLDRDVISAWS